MEGKGWSRREFAGAASLLALALGLPSAAVYLDGLDDADAPSDRQRAIMREVADMVIPDTETPGAGAAGVGDFVLLALAHGLEGARAALAPDAVSTTIRPHLRRDGSLDHARWLESTLDRAVGGDWPSKPAERKLEALATIDAQAFGPEAGAHPWRMVKGLILTGYYTSEIGGSRELAYEPLPGRYDPAVPVAPDTRAYSNEWNGVEFG